MADKPYLFSYPLPSDTGKLDFVGLEPRLYMIVSNAIKRIVEATPVDIRDEIQRQFRDEGDSDLKVLPKKALEELDTIANLMVFGAQLAVQGALRDAEEKRITFVFSQFVKRAFIEQWTHDTDPALSICYFLVHNQHMSYREAYGLAKIMMGLEGLGLKAEPQSEAQWKANIKNFRKRLSRWADAPQRQLGRVVKQGRPPKQKETGQH